MTANIKRTERERAGEGTGDRARLRLGETSVLHLAFEIGVDPLFDTETAVVGGVKTNPKGLAGLRQLTVARTQTRGRVSSANEISTVAYRPLPRHCCIDMPPELISWLVAVKRRPSDGDHRKSR